MIVCGNCGSENPDGFRFCGACATRLPGMGAPFREVRKVVSVVFCDVVGSTPLGERLDAEALRAVMGRYFAAMRGAVEGHGGRVEKFIGDAVVGVFGIPSLHEDDALRAVRAADEMRRIVPELNGELRSTWGVEIATRLGVCTGSVVVAEADEVLLGDVLNTAARLEQTAAPGEVVIAQETYTLVAHCVTAEAVIGLSLKGKREGVRGWRVQSVDSHGGFVAPALDRPLVGRSSELAILRRAFERTVAEGECALATIFGQPGIGKSRLAFEFVGLVRDSACVLEGRCASYGHGTYAPIAEMLRHVVPDEGALGQLLAAQGDGERVAQTVVSALGLNHEGTDGEETFWAFRRVFEVLAEKAPLVIVVDDLHWAEPTLLDLVDYVLEWVREQPIMVLCLARPELLERRSGWGGGRVNSVSLMLKELSDGDSERLLQGGVAGREIPAAVRARITTAARGVPLYLEQMSAMLEEAGTMRAGEIPPAVQALLAARLDALTGRERLLLEYASVEGEAFSMAGLAALAADDPTDMTLLEGLARRRLIRGTSDGQFCFRHSLIRDAAYARLPKSRRSVLHERYGAWLEQIGATSELIGFHLEQAVLLRVELGLAADDAGALALRASGLLVDAGRRADERADDAAAANLVGRAVALLVNDDEARLPLLPELGAIIGQTDPPAALTVLHEAVELARRTGNRRLEWNAIVNRSQLLLTTDPNARPLDDLLEEAQEAATALEALGDGDGAARAFWLAGEAQWMLGRNQAWQELARRGTDLVGGGAAPLIVGHAAWALASGQTPMPEVESGCRVLLDLAGENQVARALVEGCLGTAIAAQGRLDEGRALARAARDHLAAMGRLRWASEICFMCGTIDYHCGDYESAERQYKRACDGLAIVGDQEVHACANAQRAVTLCKLGHTHEGLRVLAQPTSIYDKEWIIAQHRVKALAHLADNDFLSALTHADAAVNVADTTEFLEFRADARLDRAHIRRARGEPTARADLQDAAILYDQKGLTDAAARTRALL